MSSTALPLPVRFALPDDAWAPVDPESLGVRNAAFLAARDAAAGEYHPTITVSGGWRSDAASLEQIADESIEKLRAEGAEEVELLQRRSLGTEHAPAVTQSVGAVATVEGRRQDLRQAQVVQGLVDVEDPARRVVMIYTLTCTYRQWEQVVPEFQAFMATVEVVPQQPGPPAEGQSEG
ncbi:hypothetical protein GCM10027270_15540 [Nocardioides ginkgobilobae]